MNIDINFVRRQFPALGGEWIYFDNAGGSQTLKSVADRICDYLLTTDVQLGASYEISQRAGERVQEAAQAMATYINASNPKEVIMGSSTSLLIKILSLCLSQTFKSGDEIIVTNLDHEANIGPWVDLAEKGFIIKTWRINQDTHRMHVEDLQNLLTDRTRLVAMNHVSNVVGTFNPVKEVASLAHDCGAKLCVDGVAYAPHRLIDVQDLNADFYAFSFYKVYGPHYALLYGKHELLETMPGFNHFFLQAEIPYKFQPGNVNFELSYGMLGLCDYIHEFAQAHGANKTVTNLREQAAFMFECIKPHEEVLAGRLLDYLTTKKNISIIGEKESSGDLRVPTISFVVDNLRSDEITKEVDKAKIGIRYGDFYAHRLIKDLGLAEKNGVVRVSMVHYNTVEEVDRLIESFDKIF